MKSYIAVTALALLSGCASIASGTTQEIAVTSSPTGATCDVSRQGMTLQQITTPASPMIKKSKYDLSIQCSKSGYQNAAVIDPSGVEPWVFGNILFGGLIGLIIDVSDGAQNHYDTTMNVNLPANIASAPATLEPVAIKQPIS